MPKQNYTVRLLIFMIFCAFMYGVLLVVWAAILPAKFAGNVKHPLGGGGHLHTRLAEVQDHAPVDILFLGSSLAYRGFDTRIWKERGYTAFNLGSSAQSPVQTEQLVKEFVDQLQPQVVIMEVYSILSTSDGVESSLSMIANHKLDAGLLEMAGRVGNILTFNTLIYASCRKLLGVDKNFKEPLYEAPDRYIPGGFVEHDSAEFRDKGNSNSVRKEPIAFQWDAFLRTCALLKAKNCRIIFIVTPTTSANQNMMLANPTETDNWFRSQPNYLDMNGKVLLNDSTDFFDSKHLQQGAVFKFNNALIDTLIDRNWLPVRD
ncbi:MAG: hypothetical protein IPI00_16010 [Flavobacteriales bacterium]|nr:hypothetical protein [Flavobacteriales bacterium]MBK6945512.1 hypothetical protein [Flavobacteriales bacterium]MBK7241627.1 hypothetical protein [Flavobacteriales bacterium]MBK7296382.1 hypothetical protein [Flavobacteriales bacterium]MBK9534932.1 hypothetical protein [Flavobacteriales bacterium]